jgi:hypothetical protein
MTGFPNSPRLLKGGIVTMDLDTSTVQGVIALQYNPDSLSRTLQIQAVQDGTRVDALRLRGPAVETIKLEAELDATDQLEFPDQNPNAVQFGLQPQLAQLEMLINPSVETLQSDDAMANAGTLEIIPLEQPLTLFVWSKSRVVPVRLTDFSVTEEAFDPDSGAVQKIIVLQYNPDILTRALQPQAVKEGGDRSEALRLTGPPVETIRLDAEINTMKGHCP